MVDRNGTSSTWPGGKRFAFSIIDDTDCATLHNVRAFYERLEYYGLRTTKTIWPLPSPSHDPFRGDSLDDEPYRRWLHAIESKGFEIASHGARSGGSTRDVTERALDRFREEFGSYPRTYANHAHNAECIYWGSDRFNVPFLQWTYSRLRDGRKHFGGAVPADAHYWGDLCRERIRYVRNFTYKDPVTTRCDPYFPYHDERRPMVRAWFSASEGANVNTFADLLTDGNLDELEESGGACIVYTHVADGFVGNDGDLDPRVERILARIASMNGWYANVGEILEHIERERGLRVLSNREHAQLEARWAADHFKAAAASASRRMLKR